MAIEKLILFFVAIFYVLQNAYGFNQNRVVNGNATPDGVFEFLQRLKMIFLEHGRTKLSGVDCSATIILKRHILTAAHCVVVIGERLNKNPDHESFLGFCTFN